jgi:hypothetical protein
MGALPPHGAHRLKLAGESIRKVLAEADAHHSPSTAPEGELLTNEDSEAE